MIGLLCFVVAVLASAFKSKIRLEAENATLRHQLVVLRRKVKGRAHLTNNDRWFLVQMYRWFPLILEVVTIVRPETLVHWHRAGFRRYWRWKSNSRGGRPRIERELQALIRLMSTENRIWGAPRIHICGFKATSIVGPFLRKIQRTIDERMTVARNVGSEDPDLAVRDLAGGTSILPSHSARRLALLEKAGLVDHEHRIV